MAQAKEHNEILILGGGDGLAARELLKYQDVKHITLVDLDPSMTNLAESSYELLRLNNGSLLNKKVHIIHQDAFEFLKDTEKFYDVILVDLPDPNNESLNKLYTKEFYSLVRNHLKPSGAMMVQATSPVFATEAYWTISTTIKATGLHVQNFHVDVPSFGNWGFVMGSREEIDPHKIKLKVPTKFLTNEMVMALTKFGKDEDATIIKNGKRVELKPNTLIDPHLIEIYANAWKNY